MFIILGSIYLVELIKAIHRGLLVLVLKAIHRGLTVLTSTSPTMVQHGAIVCNMMQHGAI